MACTCSCRPHDQASAQLNCCPTMDAKPVRVWNLWGKLSVQTGAGRCRSRPLASLFQKGKYAERERPPTESCRSTMLASLTDEWPQPQKLLEQVSCFRPWDACLYLPKSRAQNYVAQGSILAKQQERRLVASAHSQRRESTSLRLLHGLGHCAACNATKCHSKATRSVLPPLCDLCLHSESTDMEPQRHARAIYSHFLPGAGVPPICAAMPLSISCCTMAFRGPEDLDHSSLYGATPSQRLPSKQATSHRAHPHHPRTGCSGSHT